MAHANHDRTGSRENLTRDEYPHVVLDAGVLEVQLRQLYNDLLLVIQRDPEQEILGVALPLVDSIVAAARCALASTSGPIADATVELISHSTIHDAVPIRALDAWVVVGQLLAAISHVPAKGRS